MQTDDTSGSSHLEFDGMMAELLACIDPGLYSKYITTDEKFRKMMYDEFLKDLYRTLDAALLFWLKLSTDMDIWVFKMHRYYWCIMNKDIKGNQCTILWHV